MAIGWQRARRLNLFLPAKCRCNYVLLFDFNEVAEGMGFEPTIRVIAV